MFRLFRAIYRLNLGDVYTYCNAVKDEISFTLIYKLSIISC